MPGEEICSRGDDLFHAWTVKPLSSVKKKKVDALICYSYNCISFNVTT